MEGLRIINEPKIHEYGHFLPFWLIRTLTEFCEVNTVKEKYFLSISHAVSIV